MNLFSIIKQKISILDIASQYTNLKKTGNYWKGRCPFHNEKTASFTVTPEKDIFYCFGCNAGGDVIALISKAESCNQYEAAKTLAEQYKIEIPDISSLGFSINKNNNNFSEKNNYINICDLVSKWCHKSLLNNKAAQNYLYSRNISLNTIKSFEIGYFAVGQKAIKNLLDYSKDQNIIAQDLIKSKILIESKNGIYSPFEGRIIFGIKDHLGRLLGFGGRAFKNKAQEDKAKYYNSHENNFFNKRSILYGLNLAKNKIKEKNAVFLVEGYMDAISMIQHGFKNTVATLGTACTQEHLKQLSRYTQRLFIIYDQDSAGQKAIMRLTELCWQSNMDLYVIELPPNEDPASFLEKQEKLEPLIKKAKDIFKFFIDHIATNFDNQSLDAKLKSTKKVIDIISRIQDSLKQDFLLKTASQKFNISFETLKDQLNTQNTQNNQNNSYKKENYNSNITIESGFSKSDKITLLEKKLFSAILYFKGEINKEDIALLEQCFISPLNLFLKKIYEIKLENKSSDISTILDKFEDSQKKLISKIIVESEMEIQTSKLFEDLLLEFYKKKWKTLVYDIRLKISNAQKVGDNNLINSLLSHLDLLKSKVLQKN